MLAGIVVVGLAAWWLMYQKGMSESSPTSARNLGTHKHKLSVSRQPEKLHDLTGKATLKRRMEVAAPPFSGTSRNMNPRVPPPHVAIIPKHAARIDWKSPTASSMFKNPAFRQSYKRIHQITFGTPSTFARRGQLQTDWGPAHFKGYPIHQGRTQSWLPGVMPDVHRPENASELDHHNAPASHFDLGPVLHRRHNQGHVNKNEEFAVGNKKIVW